MSLICSGTAWILFNKWWVLCKLNERGCATETIWQKTSKNVNKLSYNFFAGYTINSIETCRHSQMLKNIIELMI